MSQTRQRPLIGMSSYRQTTSWWAWERDAALVPGTYLDVLEAAGGQAVVIPPPGDGSCRGEVRQGGVTADRWGGLGALVAALDGLVLIGGGDIDARRYGQVGDPRNGGVNDDRDDLELALLDAALRADVPVLAVCRGIQILNVHLGGELVQHLPDLVGSSVHQPRPGAFGAITVATEPGSAVRHLLGERTEVLCSHHQAIAKLGRGLVVTARSADGVIEAVELPGRRFVVGVQWHPEETGDRRLFEALVDAARGQPAPDGGQEPDGPSENGEPS